MIRRPPRSTLSSSSAASDVYKRQDLELITSWPRIHVLLLQHSGISGTLPADVFSRATSLQVLLMDGLQVSGTIAPGLFANLTAIHTISLSETRISGTLPAVFGGHNLTNVLFNNMELSGTLPVAWEATIEAVWNLKVLSFVRNRLEGRTEVLTGSTSLTTLMISGNFFSCEAVTLDGATNLGKGHFEDPTSRALNIAGALVQRNDGRNPFEDVENKTFRSTVMLFGGNPELTTDASVLPDNPASNALKADRIRQGQRRLFSGESDLKEFVYIYLPLVVGFWSITVAVSCTERGWGSYLFPDLTSSPDLCARLLLLTRMCKRAFAVCGIALTALCLCTPKIYPSACSDHLIKTSIAYVEAGTAFQWTYAILSCGVSLIATWLVALLSKMRYAKEAVCVQECLDEVVLSLSKPKAAIHVWRSKLGPIKPSLARRLVFLALHVPMMVLVSLPAVGYVLARNVPAGKNILYDLIGNTFLVVFVKLLVASFGIPRLAVLLSRVKFGWDKTSKIDPELAMRVQKSQVGSSLLFASTSSLFAPMLAVFLLDEACLRYYLSFTPGLHELMTSWDIGQQGTDAYRHGFCVRRLTSEYFYVWLTLVLAATFALPAIEMIESHPRVEALWRQIQVWGNIPCEGCYGDTLERCASQQVKLVGLLTTLLTMVTMSVFVPLLLVLAPLFCWIQIRTYSYQFRHNELSFGQRVAMRVLVQQPPYWFPCILLVALWCVMVFVMVDLSFDAGPMVVFFGISLPFAIVTIASAKFFPVQLDRTVASILQAFGPETEETDSEQPVDDDPVGVTINPMALKEDWAPTKFQFLSGLKSKHLPSNSGGLEVNTIQQGKQAVKNEETRFRNKSRESQNRQFWADMSEKEAKSPAGLGLASDSVSEEDSQRMRRKARGAVGFGLGFDTVSERDARRMRRKAPERPRHQTNTSATGLGLDRQPHKQRAKGRDDAVLSL
eukprot:TRINITY_DN3673_c0_g1_i7.p1 TRINITY_DN3673_c0_g1~~TRINITY_DN3673_c0_g1_i7.p1  ORF type:complete len:954 (+),score=139.96 TRINITY_DN3673_c0_g1_i7:103-2964(+)